MWLPWCATGRWFGCPMPKNRPRCHCGGDMCVLSSCFRPFRLEFLGQFGTVLGRLSVAGVLRVIS
ncbi:hypothetical protein CYJ46_09950 [Corynebacterium coyleae]|nr:hypothetical protein CYJ46_09950 [Corynebacterium coyleae]